MTTEKNRRNRIRRKARKYLQNSCKLCKTKEGLTIDHIIPLSLGGTNDKKNLQTLCITCHKKKDRLVKKMLQITQYENNWRIAIKSEEWEFKTLQEAESCLSALLQFKDKFGKINDFKKDIKK